MSFFNIGNKILDFSKKTYVMGILNTTPDSFYAGSRVSGIKEAVHRIGEMIKSGADIIDIGGESTRPGSESIDSEEEAQRVIPVIKAIRQEWHDIIISIDTSKANVAGLALDSGADMVNDISAMQFDPGMASLIAERKCPYVLMHIRGNPRTMQKDPRKFNDINELRRELQERIDFALNAGVKPEQIIIDPGIGFGKCFEDNILIIKNLMNLKQLSYPILIGLSRKSFLGNILNKQVNERLIGTIVANTISILNGANIIRVHDVGEAVDVVKITDVFRNF